VVLPVPEPGLVISYAYLWRYEDRAGQQESRKDRPCVIVLAVETIAGETQITVAPITHKKPANPDAGIEIPPQVKQHLRLDLETSWAIIDEVNQFIWPGYDLRPVPGTPDIFTYGYLPPRLFEKIKSALLVLAHKRRVKLVSRDEP